MAQVNVAVEKQEMTYVSVLADFNEKTGTYDSTDCVFYVEKAYDDGLVRLKANRNSTEGVYMNLLAAKALVEMLTPKKQKKTAKKGKVAAVGEKKSRGRPKKVVA